MDIEKSFLLTNLNHLLLICKANPENYACIPLGIAKTKRSYDFAYIIGAYLLLFCTITCGNLGCNSCSRSHVATLEHPR